VTRESPWKTLYADSPIRRLQTALCLSALLVAPQFVAGCARTRPLAPAAPARESAATRRRSSKPLPTTGTETLSYAVRIDEPLRQISVEVCPHGFRIERLEAPSPGAQELLGGGHIITPEGEFSCPTDGLDLPLLRADECVHYDLNLPEKTQDPTALRRVDRDLLASPDLWLWVAMPRPLHVPIRVHFTLPSGVIAALPWPAVGADFALSETAFSWKAGGAFTHAAPVALPVPGGELEWAELGRGFEHAHEVRAWLSQGARASSLLFGHFPVPNALVLGVPGPPGRASFGMALRGGGPAVVILLDSHADAHRLADDWTCTHEFLHLGVPRLPPEDAWLFEGLATYYTELVRARAGLITPAQAYQHLLDGFERGRKNAWLRTLRQASREMREQRAFYRVYWSGAALAFLTDVAARRAGGPSLDAALRSFAECCAASEEDWTAERMLARVDALLGTPRFAPVAHAWLDRAEFPDVYSVLRDLGVSPGPHADALFRAAPGAAIRDAIMARDPSALHPGAEGEPHEQQ
jgi:hypothetical protein